MKPDVCYIEWDPNTVQLVEPFRKAIESAALERREGYVRVGSSVERVNAIAEQHGQTGVIITRGHIL